MVVAQEVMRTLAAPGWEQDVPAVRKLVAQFTGKLAVHGAMENEALYPRLLTHPDETIRTKAAQLLKEVDGIYDAFQAFARDWSQEAIQAQPQGYVLEVKRLFGLLGKRMARENTELHPMADAHLGCAGPPPRSPSPRC